MIMLAASVLCFVVSELTGNYSQVDNGKLYCLLYHSAVTYSENPSPRLLLMAILVTAWGFFRADCNFWRKKVANIIPWRGEEDYRWKIMRDNHVLKGRFRFGLFNLLFISLYQNFLILLFSSPLMSRAGAGKILQLCLTWPSIIIILALLVETVPITSDSEVHEERSKGSLTGSIPLPFKKGSLLKGFGNTAGICWCRANQYGSVFISLVLPPINCNKYFCYRMFYARAPVPGQLESTEKISNGKYRAMPNT
ncbi:MAG: DUF1295 domain-containing protein [Bacteroidales bacterium]